MRCQMCRMHFRRRSPRRLFIPERTLACSNTFGERRIATTYEMRTGTTANAYAHFRTIPPPLPSFPAGIRPGQFYFFGFCGIFYGFVSANRCHLSSDPSNFITRTPVRTGRGEFDSGRSPFWFSSRAEVNSSETLPGSRNPNFLFPRRREITREKPKRKRTYTTTQTQTETQHMISVPPGVKRKNQNHLKRSP